METVITQEACRSAFRKTTRVYAIEAPDASSGSQQTGVFSTCVVSKFRGLPVSTTPAVKPCVSDDEKAHSVNAHNFRGANFGQKDCLNLASSPESSAFSLCNCEPSQVKRQDQSTIFEGSSPSCSSASIAKTYSERGVHEGFSARRKFLLSALPPRSTSVTQRTGRSGRSPQKSASSGSLTCRISGGHFQTRPQAHLLPSMQSYGSSHYSAIPAYTEDVVSSGWRRRLRTHVVRRPRACSDELAPSFSTWRETAATVSGMQKERHKLVLVGALPEDVAVEALRPRGNRSGRPPRLLAPASSASCGGVTQYSGAKVYLSHSSSPKLVCTNEAVSEPATRTSPEYTQQFPRGSAATSIRTTGSSARTYTTSNSTGSQSEAISACHENGNADCRSGGSTVNSSSKTLAATDNNDKSVISSFSDSALRVTLEPISLSSPSRLISVEDKQARVLSPLPLHTTSCLKNDESSLKNIPSQTGSCTSTPDALSTGGERKTDIQSEQSHRTVVPLFLPARSTLDGSAIQRKEHQVNLKQHSAALREDMQHTRQEKQPLAQQSEASTSGCDTPVLQQKTVDLTNRAQVAEEDQECECATPRRADVTIFLHMQPENSCEKPSQQNDSADQPTVAANHLPSPPGSLLVQQVSYVQRPMVPPPSPPRFLIPLRYRLPLRPAQPLLPEGENFSWDDEERNARPGVELASLDSGTLHSQIDDLQGRSCGALSQAAFTGSDTTLTCAIKKVGAEVRAPCAETISWNFRGTGGPARASATGKPSAVFSEAVSTPHSARDTNFNTTSIFQRCSAELKPRACLSHQRSSSEEGSNALSRVQQLEEQPLVDHAEHSSTVNEEGASKRNSYQRSVPEAVGGDGYASVTDFEVRRAGHFAAPQSMTAAIPQPRSLTPPAHDTSDILPGTPDDEPSQKGQSKPPCLRAVHVAGESKRESSRALTSVELLSPEFLLPHAGAATRQANNDKGTPAAAGDNTISRLAQYLNLSPRSRYNEGCSSPPSLSPQQVLQKAQPRQRRHCVETQSLPASPTSLSCTRQHQQKWPNSTAELPGKKPNFTRLQRSVSKDSTACTQCREVSPSFSTLRKDNESVNYKHCGAWKRRGFQDEQNADRFDQRQLWASESCCRMRPCENGERFGIYTPLLSRAPTSSPHTALPSKKSNPSLLLPISCGQDLRPCFHNRACSSFCGRQPCADTNSSVSPIHPSNGSEIAPWGSVVGYTLCPAARSVSLQSRSKPHETSQQRPLPDEAHPVTELTESKPLPLSHRTHCTFQSSTQEGGGSNSSTTTHFQSAVAANAVKTRSRDELPRVHVGHLVEGVEAPQASAVAFSASAGPGLVVSKTCPARQSVATGGDKSILHVSRTQRQDSTLISEDTVEVTQFPGSSERCPSSFSSSSETFRRKTSKRKLRPRKARSVHNHVHIRVSLWKALQKEIIALVQSAPLHAAVGSEKISSPVPLQCARSKSFRDLEPQERKSEQAALYCRVATNRSEKLFTIPDSPLQCARHTCWSYSEGPLVGEGQKLHHSYNSVHKSACLPSPSLAKTDARNGGGELDGETAAIKNSERVEERGKIRNTCACSVIHSAGEAVYKWNRGLCDRDNLAEGTQDTSQTMSSEEAAEDEIHRVYSNGCSAESITRNLPTASASDLANSPAAGTDAGRRKRNGRAPAGDDNGGADPRLSSRRRKCSRIEEGTTSSRKKHLQRHHGIYKEQQKTSGCELLCSTSSPWKSSATCKHAEQRRKNCNSSSFRESRDPPAPDVDLTGTANPSAVSRRRQTSTSAQVRCLAEQLHNSACSDTKKKVLSSSAIKPGLHERIGQVQKAYTTLRDKQQASAHQRETATATIIESRMRCVRPSATSLATVNSHRKVRNDIDSGGRKGEQRTRQQIDEDTLCYRESAPGNQEPIRPGSPFSPMPACNLMHDNEGRRFTSGFVVECHKDIQQSDSILPEETVHANGGFEEAAQNFITAGGRCSSATYTVDTGRIDFTKQVADVSADQLYYNRDGSCSAAKLQMNQDRQLRVSRDGTHPPDEPGRRKHRTKSSPSHTNRVLSRETGQPHSDCCSGSPSQASSSISMVIVSSSGKWGRTQAASSPLWSECRQERSSVEQNSDICQRLYCKEGSAPNSDCDRAGLEDEFIAQNTGGHSVWHMSCQVVQLGGPPMASKDAEPPNATEQCASTQERLPFAEKHAPLECPEEENSCLPGHTRKPDEDHGVEWESLPFHADFGPNGSFSTDDTSKTPAKKFFSNPRHESVKGRTSGEIGAVNANPRSVGGLSLCCGTPLLGASHGKHGNRRKEEAVSLEPLSPLLDFGGTRPECRTGVHPAKNEQSPVDGTSAAERQTESSSDSESSINFQADANRSRFVHRMSQFSTQSEENSHGTRSEVEVRFPLDSPGNHNFYSNDNLPAQDGQPGRSGDLSSTSCAHHFLGKNRCERTTAESRYVECTRSSLSKMEMLLKKIALLRTAVKQKESVSLPDGAAQGDNEAAFGDTMSPLSDL